MGMLSTAILVVNNIRDMETDMVTGKKTLAVKIGKSFSQIEFSILVLIPFIIPLSMWWNTRDNMSLLITLFALPIAVHLIIQLISKSGRELNKVLVGTARFLFIFTILFSLGLIL
jgi:1,4-dihydroxy-2-naphthoate octaprenyltransferase